MAGRYTLEQFEAYKQAREEREAKEKRLRQERVEKENARRIWVRDGGSEDAFEKAWPELRDEIRRKRVAGADVRARERQRGSGISKI